MSCHINQSISNTLHFITCLKSAGCWPGLNDSRQAHKRIANCTLNHFCRSSPENHHATSWKETLFFAADYRNTAFKTSYNVLSGILPPTLNGVAYKQRSHAVEQLSALGTYAWVLHESNFATGSCQILRMIHLFWRKASSTVFPLGKFYTEQMFVSL